MKWPKIVIGEIEYDLTHLDPFILDVAPTPPGSPTYKVLISFGSHTFTRELKPEDPAEHVVKDGVDERCFCPKRYACSLQLPELVRHEIKRAYFWDRGRFLSGIRLEELEHPYAIIFNVEKMTKGGTADAGLFVLTAFEKDDMPKRAAAISLATLVSKKVRCQRPVRPRDKPVTWPKKK